MCWLFASLVALGRLDRVEEVLLCERELYQNYAVLESLPVFLNLTFDQACIEYYSSTTHGSLCLTSVLNICEKWKICVEGSIHVHFCPLPLHVATEKCYTITTKPSVHVRVATNVVIGAPYSKHTRYLSETTQSSK